MIGTVLRARALVVKSGHRHVSSAVYSGVIMSRIPIITRELSEFESKYYAYQSELEKRLMWTFPQYYYFRKGTLSERRFLDANRGPVSYQPGVYFPRGNPDVKHNRERSQKQEIVVPREESADSSPQGGEASVTRPIVPQSRTTKADEVNDVKSLERALSRTLYLVVKEGETWKFPSFAVPLDSADSLHSVLESQLDLINSEKMKHWLVSGNPTCVLRYNESSALEPLESTQIAKREFLLKSHIVAGSFQPIPDHYKDFQWGTKEELRDLLPQPYFNRVEPLLANV